MLKIDNGVELKCGNMNMQIELFEDMEQIENIMHEKMLENSRKEAESIAYAIEHDKMFGIV
ncbi:MAG: hypothetical protein NC302_11195 [Bacteroidales bacterium]|nr:hypothetical protein [Bacteroidales bacterium]MCM1415147.1 hypothetical protein [bacterium]MCM1423017.1 hypothetical protein [bacterium]